jgi:quercetin dioxygenase-like cupin family protein
MVDTENNSATLISQMPGEGNRMHYHDNWNEWWYILDGEWEWIVEGKEIIVKKGDLVFIEKGKRHKITAIGEVPAIRLAVSRADVNHIYEIKNEK